MHGLLSEADRNVSKNRLGVLFFLVLFFFVFF